MQPAYRNCNKHGPDEAYSPVTIDAETGQKYPAQQIDYFLGEHFGGFWRGGAVYC